MAITLTEIPLTEVSRTGPDGSGRYFINYTLGDGVNEGEHLFLFTLNANWSAQYVVDGEGQDGDLNFNHSINEWWPCQSGWFCHESVELPSGTTLSIGFAVDMATEGFAVHLYKASGSIFETSTGYDSSLGNSYDGVAPGSVVPLSGFHNLFGPAPKTSSANVCIDIDADIALAQGRVDLHVCYIRVADIDSASVTSSTGWTHLFTEEITDFDSSLGRNVKYWYTAWYREITHAASGSNPSECVNISVTTSRQGSSTIWSGAIEYYITDLPGLRLAGVFNESRSLAHIAFVASGGALELHTHEIGSNGRFSPDQSLTVEASGAKNPSVVRLPDDRVMVVYEHDSKIKRKIYQRPGGFSSVATIQDPGNSPSAVMDAFGRIVLVYWNIDRFYVRVFNRQSNGTYTAGGSGVDMSLTAPRSTAGQLIALPDGSLEFFYEKTDNTLQRVRCRQLKSTGAGTWS